MTQDLELVTGKDEGRAQALSVDIGRIKDALQSNVEATLVIINTNRVYVIELNSFFFFF